MLATLSSVRESAIAFEILIIRVCLFFSPTEAGRLARPYDRGFRLLCGPAIIGPEQCQQFRHHAAFPYGEKYRRRIRRSPRSHSLWRDRHFRQFACAEGFKQTPVDQYIRLRSGVLVVRIAIFGDDEAKAAMAVEPFYATGGAQQFAAG